MKKILVCGGSGFIGLNLVKFFKNKNYKVSATYKTKRPKNIIFGPLPKTATGKIQKHELRQRIK